MPAYPITPLQATVLNNLSHSAAVLRQAIAAVKADTERASKELGLGLTLSFTNAAELDKRAMVFNAHLNEVGVVLDHTGMMSDDIERYVRSACTEDPHGIAGRHFFYASDRD